MFDTIDENNDGHLSFSELKALLIGIRFDEIDLDRDDAVAKVIKDFDTSRDSKVDFPEFFKGISRWLLEAKRAADVNEDPGFRTMKFLNDFHMVSFAYADIYLVLLVF